MLKMSAEEYLKLRGWYQSYNNSESWHNSRAGRETHSVEVAVRIQRAIDAHEDRLAYDRYVYGLSSRTLSMDEISRMATRLLEARREVFGVEPVAGNKSD